MSQTINIIAEKGGRLFQSYWITDIKARCGCCLRGVIWINTRRCLVCGAEVLRWKYRNTELRRLTFMD